MHAKSGVNRICPAFLDVGFLDVGFLDAASLTRAQQRNLKLEALRMCSGANVNYHSAFLVRFAPTAKSRRHRRVITGTLTLSIQSTVYSADRPEEAQILQAAAGWLRSVLGRIGISL